MTEAGGSRRANPDDTVRRGEAGRAHLVNTKCSRAELVATRWKTEGRSSVQRSTARGARMSMSVSVAPALRCSHMPAGLHGRAGLSASRHVRQVPPLCTPTATATCAHACVTHASRMLDAFFTHASRMPHGEQSSPGASFPMR